jgi:hypothetical protein
LIVAIYQPAAPFIPTGTALDAQPLICGSLGGAGDRSNKAGIGALDAARGGGALLESGEDFLGFIGGFSRSFLRSFARACARIDLRFGRFFQLGAQGIAVLAALGVGGMAGENLPFGKRGLGVNDGLAAWSDRKWRHQQEPGDQAGRSKVAAWLFSSHQNRFLRRQTGRQLRAQRPVFFLDGTRGRIQWPPEELCAYPLRVDSGWKIRVIGSFAQAQAGAAQQGERKFSNRQPGNDLIR